jgi:tRNA threonylcarbamoyladenosine biosynthesis protein TsaE
MPAKVQVYREVKEPMLEAVAHQVLQSFPDMRVVALSGTLGAGKTAMVKAFARCLGVTHDVNSPTFALIHEYAGAVGEPVYHFDFYRIKNEQEARELGTEEYLFSGRYCFVEWPEKIQSLLPDRYVAIRLIPEDELHRTIEIQAHG